MESNFFSKNADKYNCIVCHFITSNKYNYNKHIMTLKHKINEDKALLEINGNSNFVCKNASFDCSICNFYSKNKTNYDKHLLTEKHINKIKGEPKNTKHICSQCNKEYLNNSGLWKHKKHCVVISEQEPLQNKFIPGNVITPELFMEVFRESKELQQVLIEQNKQLQNKLIEKDNQLLEQNNKLLEKDNILIEQNNKIIELASKPSNINSHNTNNNQFNLQFFLNETCKDAMNIVDFVNSLQLTTDDFETTGKLGFVEGISRIFIKELKKLNTEKLPIHCTDLKRETVYIKDNDKWEKENNEKQKLKWTIDKIAQLNLVQHHNWQEKYPVCIENNTKENEYFFKLAAVALGGKCEDEKDKYREKIMRNVLKEVVLDKQTGKHSIAIHP
jgi:hypothetical protein